MADSLDIYSYAKMVPLPYYEAKLSEDNSFRFQYMSPKQKEATRVRLVNSLVVIRVQAQEDMLRGRRKKLAFRAAQLQHCCDLLHAMQNVDDQIQLEAGRDCPLGYLGLHASLNLVNPTPENALSLRKLAEEARVFAQHVQALDGTPSDQNDETREFIGQFNDWRRLHWVAGVSMGQATLALIWDQHQVRGEFQTQFDSSVDVLNIPFGYISVFLYFYRLFFVDLKEAIEQAVSKWQLDTYQTEKVQLPDAGAWQRFKNDVLGIRKYILLNDLLWSIVNTMCFFWLTAKNNLMHVANILTLAFLLVDVSLTLARYLESRSEYQSERAKIQNNFDTIGEKIAALQASLSKETEESDEKTKLKNQIMQLKETQEQLNEAGKKLDFNWKYQQYKLWAELGYTGSLVIAFGIMCSFFIPTTALAVSPLILGVVGAAAWFVMTLVFNGVNAWIDHLQASECMNEKLRLVRDHLIPDFNGASNAEEKKGIYLHIKALLARTDQEKRQAAFAWKRTMLQSFAHALVPVLLVCTISLMYWPFALLVLGAYVAVLYAGKRLLDYWEQTHVTLNPNKFFPGLEKDRADQACYIKEFERLEQKNTLSLEDFEGYAEPVTISETSDQAVDSWLAQTPA